MKEVKTQIADIRNLDRKRVPGKKRKNTSAGSGVPSDVCVGERRRLRQPGYEGYRQRIGNRR